MPQPPFLYKDPDESKLYGVDFSATLGTGETISTATAVGDSGITVGATSISGSVVEFRLSGGISGTSYTVVVTITTSDSNTYEETLTISVESTGWLSRLVIILRVLIGDLESTPTYTDSRLLQVLCVAAHYTQQDIQVDTYTIDVSTGSITPDPTVPTDTDNYDPMFVNLVALKAACIIDQGSLRMKAASAGIKAALGPLSLDTSSPASVEAISTLISKGACATYKELVRDYLLGNTLMTFGIFSPFISNTFDPTRVNSTVERRVSLSPDNFF